MPKTSRPTRKAKPARRKTATRKSVTRKMVTKKKSAGRKTSPKRKVVAKKKIAAKARKKVVSRKKVVARKKAATPKRTAAKPKPKPVVKAKAKVTRPESGEVPAVAPAPVVVKPTKSRLIKANATVPPEQTSALAPSPSRETPELALQVGQMAPDFSLRSNDGSVISLSHFRGSKVVLYFYPKDDTPGCTKEACSFRDGLMELEHHGAVVLGVSVDPVASHEMFHERYGLNFPLLSDESKETVRAYGVWTEKSFQGRTWMATDRTTFIIDEEGKIARIFPKVQVDGHFEEVLAAL